MQANTFFNALLRPGAVRLTIDEQLREQVPPHRRVLAAKVLKSQETMHRAVVWRELHSERFTQTMEKRWVKELEPFKVRQAKGY